MELRLENKTEKGLNKEKKGGMEINVSPIG